MTVQVREDDVVLFRAGSGTIHLGIRLGRVFDSFCCTIVDSPHVRTWTGDDAAAYADAKADYLCPECVLVADKPWRTIRNITGW